jgi:hypothetical protein
MVSVMFIPRLLNIQISRTAAVNPPNMPSQRNQLEKGREAQETSGEGDHISRIVRQITAPPILKTIMRESSFLAALDLVS